MSYLLLSAISGQKIGALSYTDGDSIPDHFANGLPFETDGSLAVDVDGVISHYHQGLPFSADGRLVGTLSETPTRFGGGAAPFSAESRLVLGSSGVTHYSGGVGYTEAGSIGAVASAPPTCWPEPIGPCSTAMQRYLWEMDGQSMYWRRESNDYGQTVNARLRVAFTGGSGVGLQYLVGRHSNDRFYIALNDSKVCLGNGADGLKNQTTVDLAEINLAELVADGTDVKFYVNNVLVSTQTQSWTGLLDDVGFGVKGDQQQEFYSGSIYSVAVETDTENDVYPLDGNGPTEFPIGSTNPNAKLTRENEELDGSDIILIDRQADNGGWDTVANIWEPAVKAITGSATSPTPTSITIDEVGNNTPLAGVQIFSSGLVGDVIRVTGNATINNGQVDISLLSGLAGVAASITASGPFSFDLDSTGYVGFKRAFAGGADATITNLKVITILDFAAGAVQELGAYSAEYSAEYGA